MGIAIAESAHGNCIGAIMRKTLKGTGNMVETNNANVVRSFMARQGDVLILAVDSVPSALEPIERENGRVILAHGEVTGHAHAIKAEGAALFRDPKLMAVFMTVSADGPVALEHDEHSTIMLPPGSYQVIRQREYAPEAPRYVAD